MMRGTPLVLGVALASLACSSSSPSASATDAGDARAATMHDGGSAPPRDSGTDAKRDAEAGHDAQAGHDAGAPPDAAGVDAHVAEAGGCGAFTGDTVPTCSGDGGFLGSCAGGTASVEACPYGCLHGQGDASASCLLASATNFTCTGSYGTVPVNDGNYYITEFGCYVNAAGMVVTDPDDNCIPACLAKAQAAGLCAPGSSGPDCEEAVSWYTADGARFGCLARLRVTNPANGKSVIAVALDYGPGCSGENGVSHAVLDSSGALDDYLFGGPEGSSDRALVHVVQVADTTPLGPE